MDERVTGGADIVSVVDETETGREYVIADVSRDDAWVSVTEQEAVALKAWR